MIAYIDVDLTTIYKKKRKKKIEDIIEVDRSRK